MLNLQFGDIVTLARGAWPCGRTLPCIERTEGRGADLKRLAD